ncbi:MAG TPA: tetratricopeptide repeat protein [Pyrinomonadaceae bacterium]|jgi:hypothetical protein
MSHPQPPAANQLNPFPGLRPFEFDESNLFFGRDGQSDELSRRLRRNRFLAVVGTSGSGKSSLVRAGLLPALYGGFMTQAGPGWRVALFRPGNDPIGNLARALADPAVCGQTGDGTPPDAHALLTEATLRRGALGLVTAVKQARLPRTENLLIVVDQFEEIFRFKRAGRAENAEDDAAAFVKLLLEAAKQTELPVYVLITMRSDFLGDCAQFRDLPEAINDGQYLIPRMTRDQRREAVTGPVAVGGARMTPRLVNRLLNDVGDNPDQLPILQHALMRTWDHWSRAQATNGERAPIDTPDYEAVGGMAGALSRHADEAYAELADERTRAVAERVFKALTEKGPDNREIRRPTQLRELAETAGASEAEVARVVETFRRPGRSFLMPPAEVALRPDSLIDISHESLIRGWQRLRAWTDEEAQSAQIYHRLAETAELHKAGKAGLWRDPDLAVALAWRDEQRPNEAWAARYAPNFADALRFLDDSQAARDAERAEREEHQRREVRRTRLFTLFLGVAFLAALGFGVAAYGARGRAVESARQAEASRLMAEDQARIARQREGEALAAQKQATDNLAMAKEQAELAGRKAEEARQQFERAQAAIAAQQRAAAEARAAKDLAEKNLRVAQAAQQRAAESEKKWQAEALAAQRQSYDNNDLIRAMADRLVQVTPRQEAVVWRTVKANALTNVGNHKEAEAELTATLDADPENFRARQLRGYMYMLTRQPDKSVADLRAVLQEQPDSALNHLNLAVGLSLNGRYDEARVEVADATRLFVPGEYDSLIENEVAPAIKQVTGRDLLTTSDEDFRSALEYQRANIEAYMGGDFVGALTRARQRPATSAAYLTALNWAWLNERQRPEDYGTLAAQGALWEQAGYRENALRAYADFLARHRAAQQTAAPPATAQRYDALARWVGERQRALDPAGAFGHTRAPAELAYTTDARSAPALALEARRLLARADTGRAEEELRTAADELKQAQTKLAQATGDAPLFEAARQRAQARYDRAVEELHATRAEAERARQLLDRAVELEPNNLTILQQRLRLQYDNAENASAAQPAAGDDKPATDVNNKPAAEDNNKTAAADLAGGHPFIRRAPLTRVQAYRAALADAEAILRQSPRNSVAYYYRALVKSRLLAAGAKDDNLTAAAVEADARKAVEYDPLNADAAVFLALYVAEDKPDEALRLFKRTLKIYPGTPWIFYQIARLENRAGAYADARAAIEQAIALHLDSPDKRDDAATLKTYYDELEEAEIGVRVPAAVRQRRKAERLVTLGDAELRLGQPHEAYDAYARAREQYQQLAGGQTEAAAATPKQTTTAALECDLARVNAKLREVFKVGREKKVYDSVVSSVVAVAPGAGPVREVTIERGARDGMPEAGAKVAVASVYDAQAKRDVKQIGTGEIVRVEPDTTLVRVTLNDPTGDGVVRAGDTVEHKALVPDLPVRSVLWRMAAEFNITFLDGDGKASFYDYRKLYANETPELVDSILDAMIADIHATAARDDLRDALAVKLEGGRFKGQTLGEAMRNTKRADLLGFLNFVEAYPGKYYGHRFKLNETYATWLINNTPEGDAANKDGSPK